MTYRKTSKESIYIKKFPDVIGGNVYRQLEIIQKVIMKYFNEENNAINNMIIDKYPENIIAELKFHVMNENNLNINSLFIKTLLLTFNFCFKNDNLISKPKSSFFLQCLMLGFSKFMTQLDAYTLKWIIKSLFISIRYHNNITIILNTQFIVYLNIITSGNLLNRYVNVFSNLIVYNYRDISSEYIEYIVKILFDILYSTKDENNYHFLILLARIIGNVRKFDSKYLLDCSKMFNFSSLSEKLFLFNKNPSNRILETYSYFYNYIIAINYNNSMEKTEAENYLDSYNRVLISRMNNYIKRGKVFYPQNFDKNSFYVMIFLISRIYLGNTKIINSGCVLIKTSMDYFLTHLTKSKFYNLYILKDKSYLKYLLVLMTCCLKCDLVTDTEKIEIFISEIFKYQKIKTSWFVYIQEILNYLFQKKKNIYLDSNHIKNLILPLIYKFHSLCDVIIFNNKENLSRYFFISFIDFLKIIVEFYSKNQLKNYEMEEILYEITKKLRKYALYDCQAFTSCIFTNLITKIIGYLSIHQEKHTIGFRNFIVESFNHDIEYILNFNKIKRYPTEILLNKFSILIDIFIFWSHDITLQYIKKSYFEIMNSKTIEIWLLDIRFIYCENQQMKQITFHNTTKKQYSN